MFVSSPNDCERLYDVLFPSSSSSLLLLLLLLPSFPPPSSPLPALYGITVSYISIWSRRNEAPKAVYYYFIGAANKILLDHGLETAKSRLTYDWVTKVTIDLRLSYDFPFGPFKKRKKVTIDLRFSIWALQETQKSYDWLTIFRLGLSKNQNKLRLTYDWVTIDLQSYNSDLREL